MVGVKVIGAHNALETTAKMSFKIILAEGGGV
jgi:hypothetical protein